MSNPAAQAADENAIDAEGSAGSDAPEVDSAAAQRSHLPPEIRLGHDITRGLEHLPETDAAEQIATHLRKFWEPRMRRALVQRVRDGDGRVDPLLASAVRDFVQDDIDKEEVAEPSGG